MEWQTKTNLVAPSTLANLWTRHISDSLQLMVIARQQKRGRISAAAAASLAW